LAFERSPNAARTTLVGAWTTETEAERQNSLHKLDTLIAALKVFRKGLVEEFAEYDRRERELEELRGE
jgi:hypothetical protein